MSHVRILSGQYGKKRIFNNEVFELTKTHWQQGQQWLVEIQGVKDGDGLEDRKCRVKIDNPDCIVYCDEHGDPITFVESHEDDTDNYSTLGLPTAEQLVLDYEDESDTMRRIRRQFEIQDELANAVCAGVVRGLIVSGPPGIGKSFGIEHVLKQHNLHHKLTAKTIYDDEGAVVDNTKFKFIKGTSSAFGLYMSLYNSSSPGEVLVFDDCDYPLLFDDQCLNLLKGALDSGDKRTLNWNSDSKTLKQEDIPTEFEFKGCVIFLTNMKFDTVKGRTREHIDALLSRCHYLDLEIGTIHEKVLRIKQVVADGMLDKYNFNDVEQTMIVNWIQQNKDYLREVSLRTVIKVADLYNMDKTLATDNWEEYAEATCLKRSAKFARIVKEQNLLERQAQAEAL